MEIEGRISLIVYLVSICWIFHIYILSFKILCHGFVFNIKKEEPDKSYQFCKFRLVAAEPAFKNTWKSE